MPASVASSSAGARGRDDGNVVASLAFPLLSTLELGYGAHFTWVSMTVDLVQLAAFAVLPHATHGEGIQRLAYVLYASHLPAWDQKLFFVLSPEQYSPFFWTASLLIIGSWIVAFVVVSMQFSVRKRAWGVTLARWAIHTCTTVLFIPLLQGLLSLMVCASNGTFWTFEANVGCWSGQFSATFAVGIVASSLLLAAGITASSLLYDFDPQSLDPCARPAHGFGSFSCMLVLWKAISCVLMHVLVGNGHHFWFALYMCLSAMFMASSVILVLPFYSQWTNRVATSGLMLVALLSFTAAVTSHSHIPSLVPESDMDTLAVLVLAMPVLAIGRRLADSRISDAFLRGLPFIVDNTAPTIDAPFFPRNLPPHDMAYVGLRAVVEDVAEGTVNSGDDAQEGPQILLPFVSEVWFPSDVEVATRFVDQYVRLTKFTPGVRMLVITTRIFTKGVTRFADNASVYIAFANMLFTYAGRSRAGLAQLESFQLGSGASGGRVGRGGFAATAAAAASEAVSLPLQFHAFRLGQHLKADLNLRDANYQKVCSSTKKLYKDSLEQIALFWTKLLAEQQDFAQLFTVATQISAKRAEAAAEFSRAFGINGHDRTIAARFASFLEHVMMEKDRAESLRAALNQEAEERKWSAMRGARKGGRTAQATFDITHFIEDRGNEAESGNSGSTVTGDGASAVSSGPLGGYRRAAASLVLVLVCIVGGLFAYAFAGHSSLKRRVQGAEAASRARGIAAHSAVLASAIVADEVKLNRGDDSLSTELSSLRSALHANVLDLRVLLRSISFGDFRPSTSSGAALTMGPTTLLTDTEGVRRLDPRAVPDATSSIRGGFAVVAAANARSATASTLKEASAVATDANVRDVLQLAASRASIVSDEMLVARGFASVGFLTVERLMTFADPTRAVSSATPVSSVHRREVAVTSAVLRDSRIWTATAFNQSVLMSVSAFEVVGQGLLSGLVVAFLLSIFTLTLLFGVLASHAGRVAEYRISILGLFVLVPREVVSSLQTQASGRIGHLDEEEAQQQEQMLGSSSRSQSIVAGQDVLRSLTRTQEIQDDNEARAAAGEQNGEGVVGPNPGASSDGGTAGDGADGTAAEDDDPENENEEVDDAKRQASMVESSAGAVTKKARGVGSSATRNSLSLAQLPADIPLALCTSAGTLLVMMSLVGFSLVVHFHDRVVDQRHQMLKEHDETFNRWVELCDLEREGGKILTFGDRSPIESLYFYSLSGSERPDTAANIAEALAPRIARLGLQSAVLLSGSTAFSNPGWMSGKDGSAHSPESNSREKASARASRRGIVGVDMMDDFASDRYAQALVSARDGVGLSLYSWAHDSFNTNFSDGDSASAGLDPREDVKGISISADLVAASYEATVAAGRGWLVAAEIFSQSPSQSLGYLLRKADGESDLKDPAFALPAKTAVGEAGRKLYFGAELAASREAARQALADLAVRQRAVVHLEESSAHRWALVLAPLFCIFLASVAFMASVTRSVQLFRKHRGEESRKLPSIITFACLLCVWFTSLGALGTSTFSVSVQWHISQDAMDALQLRTAENATAMAHEPLASAARRFVHTGEPAAYQTFTDLLSRHGATMRTTENVVGLEASAKVGALLERLRTVELSALALAVSGYSDSADVAGTPPAANPYMRLAFSRAAEFEWDLTKEVDATAARVTFASDPLMYSNRVADSKKSADARIAISRATLFGARYVGIEDEIRAEVSRTAGSIRRTSTDRRESSEKLGLSLAYASVVISALAVLLGASAATFLFRAAVTAHSSQSTTGSRSLDANDESGRSQSNSAREGRDIPRAASNSVRKSGGKESASSSIAAASASSATGGMMTLQVSLFGVACCFAAVFAVGLVQLQKTSEFARNADRAGALAWQTSLAMLDANAAVSGTVGGLEGAASLDSRIQAVVEARGSLLFLGDKTDAFNAIGHRRAFDDYFFSRDQSLGRNYGCIYRPEGSPSSNELLASGLSAAITDFVSNLEQLRVEIVAFFSVPSVKSKENMILRMTTVRNMYHPLRAALIDASDRFMAVEIDELHNWHTVLIATVCATLGALFAAVVLVVIPVAGRLSKEHAESTLMLKMMPEQIREDVPAIAEFIEHTIASGTFQPPSVAVDNTYTAPIVVIDSKGTVLKFNSAAEDCFGFDTSEVVGNNVKMLMPVDVARGHDGYLHRYAATGIRRIIGAERQVKGRRKDGSLFPMALNIKELRRAAGDLVFIGFVQDITRRTELGRMQELNDVIQDLAPVPIIAIDSLGTVTRFNRASERCFGHLTADVLGQNVKMLMPESIAKHHDAYLANYLRTREKRVIDTIRRVVGLTKGGEEFVLELAVKEISTSDVGSQSTYLGFARDLTQDLVLEEANRINDEISDLSPIPIIGADAFGHIIKFNRAAQEALGYSTKEVIQKNLKMLMPTSVARNHDGYLEAYRRTCRKTIIGSEREIHALHKDGSEIPMRIYVGEAKKDGMQATFLGYLIDVREEKRHARSSSINEAVREHCRVPIVTMTSAGIVMSINPAVGQEFGYREEEVVGQNVKMMMPPEYAMNHDAYLANYRKTRIPKVIGGKRRVPAKRKNGTIFMIEICVEEIDDGEGNYTYVGFLRNLTHELEVEQQFKVNDTVLQISSVPMIAIDAKGTVLTFSRAAETTWGHEAGYVIGKNVKMLMPEYYASQHDMFLVRYIETGVPRIIDTNRVLEAEDASGRIFPCEVSVREVRSDSGERRESMFVGYARDMSKDGEVQQIIQRNEQVSNLSPIPLLQIDVFGVIQKFNTAAEREFGYSREELVGRNVKMLMPESISQQHDGFLAAYRRTRERRVVGKLRRTTARRKDGSTFPVELAVDEIVVDPQQPEQNFYIGYLRNITETVQLLQTNLVSGVISELSPTPLLAISDKGLIIKFNRAACDTFGYADDEIIGQNVKLLMPDGIAVKHDGYLHAYAKTGEKHVIDLVRVVRAKRRDGHTFPAEVSVRELQNESSGDKMFWGYIRDCTDDFRKDQAVRVADAVQELSTAPIIRIDQHGIIHRCNQATSSLFGYTMAELLGQNIKKLMPPSIAAKHDGYLRTYLATGRKHVIDSVRLTVARLKDGQEIPVEIGVREVKIADGTLFLGFVVDSRARMARLESHAMDSAIKNASPTPLVAIDDMGIVLEFNPGAVHFFGYTEDEVVGQNLKMLMTSDVANVHDEYLSRYRETGVKHIIGSSRVVRARLKNGIVTPVEVSIREIKTAESQIFVGFVNDVSISYEAEKNNVIFDKTLEMVTMPVVSITVDGIIRRVNRAAVRDFGYDADEVLGKNVRMLMLAEVAIHHDMYLSKYLQTKEKHVIGSTRDIHVKRKDGTAVPFELNVNEFSVDGNDSYVGFFRNRVREVQTNREEQMNDAIIHLSSIPIVAITEVGRIITFSRAAQEEFGYAVEETLGKNVTMLMTDAHATKHAGYLKRFKETGVKNVIDQSTETLARHRNGSTIPIELTVRQIAKEGLAPMFVAYLRNIEKDLEDRSNQRVGSLLEGMISDPLIVIDPRGTVQSFTPAAQMSFGYSRGEVIGQNVKMLMPPEVASQHDGYLRTYSITRKKNVIDNQRRVRALRKDGSSFELELNVREITAANGSVYFVGYCRDCSDDFQLVLQRDLGEALLELNPDALISVDAKGTILRFNAAAEEMFRFKRSQVVGRNVKILMPDRIAKRHDQFLAQYQLHHVKRVVDNVRIVEAERKNGETFPAEISVREMKDSDGQSMFVGYIRELQPENVKS